MSFNYIRELSKLKVSHEVFTKLRRRYHLPSTMKCLVINGYANSVAELDTNTEHICPTAEDLKPSQALVKVHAASLNPIDIEMMKGFGHEAINILRKQANVQEFPLILGRDFSGEIVARGKRFQRFELGDSVYGMCGVGRQGAHAEYVIVNTHEISRKPENIDFVEAASLPAAACITWSVFIDSGVLAGNKPKRILIPGGSGGIGSFATQFCQMHGHEVITTCKTDAIPLLEGLGIKNIIAYDSESYEADLTSAGPFDVILGTLKDKKHIGIFESLLKPSISSNYISLHASLLEEADKEVLYAAQDNPVKNVLQFTINQVSSRKGLFSWGFAGYNGRVLNDVKGFIDDGSIRTVIDKKFHIDDALDAYESFESGNARGKTIITMCDS